MFFLLDRYRLTFVLPILSISGYAAAETNKKTCFHFYRDAGTRFHIKTTFHLSAIAVTPVPFPPKSQSCIIKQVSWLLLPFTFTPSPFHNEWHCDFISNYSSGGCIRFTRISLLSQIIEHFIMYDHIQFSSHYKEGGVGHRHTIWTHILFGN